MLTIFYQINRNLVLHGLEATGKTLVTKALLEQLSSSNRDEEATTQLKIRHAIVKSAECISGRHLLEQTIGSIAKATEWEGSVARCENLAQLVVEVERLLCKWSSSSESEHKRFVLVFDGIDHQRDAPPSLLPALARLGEIVSNGPTFLNLYTNSIQIPNLTTLFIVTSPRPNFLHFSGVPHIEFPSYTKTELLQILSLTIPTPSLPTGPEDTQEVWSRFNSAVWDSLSKHSGRDILSFRDVSLRLWPRFIKPILEGNLSSTPFTKLLVANRSLFQDDTALTTTIISTSNPLGNPLPLSITTQKYSGIGAQLPYYSRLLLVSAYLSSFNPPKTDITYFLKSSLTRRKKRGGGTALTRTTSKPGVSKSRKISRKLLGPQAFILERMLAIFQTLKEDADGEGRYNIGMGKKGKGNLNGNADIQMAVATLVSLRLLVRVGNGDVLDGGCKFRVAVGWEVVRGVARSVGVEAEDYLAE